MFKSIYTRLLNHASISQQPVHPLNLIIRPAGVAQSVERVALILSDIPNLKVEGSSPSFGYSYKRAAGILFALSCCPRKDIWDGGGEKIFFFWCVKPGLGGQGRRWTWIWQTYITRSPHSDAWCCRS
jgi:hypothetical protein